MRRVLVIAVMTASITSSLVLAAPAPAVTSTQQFSLSTSRAAPAAPTTVSAEIGSGVAVMSTLGLIGNLSLKAFNTPAGIGVLVTGSSPLPIRAVLPATLTSVTDDPQFGWKLSFAFPADLQQPAPGAIGTFTDIQLTLPAQYAAVSGSPPVPLAATTACTGGGWDAKYVAAYTDGTQQTVASRQACTAADVGASSLTLHAWFGDISADAGSPFANRTADVYLPKDLRLNLNAFPSCAVSTILAGEASCPTGHDSDADGVVDTADRCPNVAATTANGCPAPIADADRDGVGDAADHCPALAGTAPTGCPASALRATLRLRRSVLRVSRTGTIRVPVGCPAQAAAACRGSLTLKPKSGGAAIGVAHYRVAAGHTSTITVILSYRAARAVLERRRKLSTTLRLLNSAGTVVARRSLLLHA